MTRYRTLAEQLVEFATGDAFRRNLTLTMRACAGGLQLELRARADRTILARYVARDYDDALRGLRTLAALQLRVDDGRLLAVTADGEQVLHPRPQFAGGPS